MLLQNQVRSSPCGNYHFTMQSDGDLILYVSRHFCPKNSLWNSETHGKSQGPFICMMQEDGNLVVYDRNNNPIWASGTNNDKNQNRLDLQTDGNLVIYNQNQSAVWSSGTNR